MAHDEADAARMQAIARYYAALDLTSPVRGACRYWLRAESACHRQQNQQCSRRIAIQLTKQRDAMTDSPPDDARLHSVEVQMRHALGLHGDTPPRTTPTHPATTPIGSPTQRRRFVQDGEVPVTLVRRDHNQGGDTGTNQLDVARAAVRSAGAARERAERLLEEAQSTIRALQTKLAHERLAKDEALEAARRAEADTQSVRIELANEREARRTAERERERAIADRQDAERRLRDTIADRQARASARSLARDNGLVNATRSPRKAPAELDADAFVGASEAVRPAIAAIGKKRGRKPKAPALVSDEVLLGGEQPDTDGEAEADVVEWWKPGWQDRFR